MDLQNRTGQKGMERAEEKEREEEGKRKRSGRKKFSRAIEEKGGRGRQREGKEGGREGEREGCNVQKAIIVSCVLIAHSNLISSEVIVNKINCENETLLPQSKSQFSQSPFTNPHFPCAPSLKFP